MKKINNQILYSIFVGLILIGFQNCNNAAMVFSNSQNDAKFFSGGNGYGYEGKIQGTYVRNVKGHTCEGQLAPASLIKISEFSVEYIENQKNECGVSKYISFSHLDSSNIENGVIAYLGGIYNKEELNANPMTAVNYEAWCHWENAANTESVDILIYRIEEAYSYEVIQENFSITANNHLEARAIGGRIFNVDAQSASFNVDANSELSLEIDLSVTNGDLDFQYNGGITLNHPQLDSLIAEVRCRAGGNVLAIGQ